MVRGVHKCFFFQAEDGIRDYKVTGVQTCSFPKAEDGIRDYKVTGVQTCALPILPLSVKDVLPTRGLTTTGGSRLFADFLPEEDALAVGRLKAAGTVLLGKTNTSEFGHKAFTESPLFGVTCNPWDPTLTPGGSSGGGAAAVASGVGPIALGTDAGGSIRIPASFCGLYGFKPSFGRVPDRAGFCGFERGHHGRPITRPVRDAAAG